MLAALQLIEPRAPRASDEDPYLEITLLSILIASATAFLAEYLMRRFLYSRLLNIYKIISNQNQFQSSLLADAEEIGKA